MDLRPRPFDGACHGRASPGGGHPMASTDPLYPGHRDQQVQVHSGRPVVFVVVAFCFFRFFYLYWSITGLSP